MIAPQVARELTLFYIKGSVALGILIELIWALAQLQSQSKYGAERNKLLFCDVVDARSSAAETKAFKNTSYRHVDDVAACC